MTMLPHFEDGELPHWWDFDIHKLAKFYSDTLRTANMRGPDRYDAIVREMAEHDLFFLLAVVLKRKDMWHPWLLARCREYQLAPYDHLDLWAREHYKSTIITFGGTILEIIRDPEVTIGLFSHTRPIAKAFMRQIKMELERNTELPRLWPEIFWERPKDQAPKWSEDEGLVVIRKTNPKESTIEAWGLVDGQPTSKHYGILHYDDIVTQGSISTKDQRTKTTEAWQNSSNLGKEGGHKKYIGTRWHLFDTWSDVIKAGAAIIRQYPATPDGTEATMDRPVLMRPKTLKKKRIDQGPYVFSTQMLMNPVADKAMGFRSDWLRYATLTHTSVMSSMNRYIVVDPASKKKKKNDYTSMWVIAVGADGKFMVVDGVYDRLNLSERQKSLFALHRKWQPLATGYEEYGMQVDVEFMELMMEEEHYRFDITRLGGLLGTDDRIKRLIPRFERGDIYLPNALVRHTVDGNAVDLVRQFIEEEYLAFPVGAHDDALSNLSRILDAEMGVRVPEASQLIGKGRDAYDFESLIDGTAEQENHDPMTM